MSGVWGTEGPRQRRSASTGPSPYSRISLGTREAVAIRLGAAKKPRGGHQALQGQCGCVLIDPS